MRSIGARNEMWGNKSYIMLQVSAVCTPTFPSSIVVSASHLTNLRSCFLFSRNSTSPGESDSCQLLSRKRRRGVIEKKRRDRINSSLSELKRLVPSAYEKQGSAKLEKAEILQLTVDHLKQLHARGKHLTLPHFHHSVDFFPSVACNSSRPGVETMTLFCFFEIISPR